MSEKSPALSLMFDPAALRPLIAAVVAEALAQTRQDELSVGSRLAYTEAEAAALIGLKPHQLRDERLRGRIGSSRGPGGRVLYAKEDLTAYLARSRAEAAQPSPN